MRIPRHTLGLGLLVALACSPPGLPTPTAVPPPTTPPTSPALQRLQMSGRVLDQDGIPVVGATVEVDYPAAGGASTPPSHCPFSGQWCWLVTLTDASGAYAVEFEPRPVPDRGFGYVYAFRDGFEVDVQWVPEATSPVVRDLRLPATRPISAGGSTVVTVGPASSLCTDLEDLWVLTQRCEIVVIESGEGIVDVEVLPAPGGTPPSLFWYTSGEYAGFIRRPAPGRLSIPVRGGRYRVLVAIPDDTASREFGVFTTLRPVLDGRLPAVE